MAAQTIRSVNIASPPNSTAERHRTPGSGRRVAITPELGIEGDDVRRAVRSRGRHPPEFTITASSRRSLTSCRASARSPLARGRIRATAKGGDFIHMPAWLRTWRLIDRYPILFIGVVVRSTAMPIVVNLPDETWRSVQP